MDIREEKAALRRSLKEQRAALDPRLCAQWDEEIARKVIGSEWFAKADMVFCYVSVGREVDTSSILDAAWRQGKRIAVPRCAAKGQMDFFVINSREELAPGAYHIPEPKEACPRAEATPDSLCIVPGLSFDQRGYRLGYGGGYYDRFLAQFPGRSVGLVRSLFLVQKLPAEEYDLAVDAIITEKE